MEQETVRKAVVKAKDTHSRSFNHLTDNFHVIMSALRYYSVKKGKTFTSNEMAEDFPVSIPVAGSCLSLLEELDVVKPRTRSSSPDRYMPRDTDMERMMEVKEILEKNYEIENFMPDN
ncbi:MAG: hypothetical protein H8Z69_04530 [Nanohaloarchaea archaeon]|nr:hypothetical protein [Candidatus Nanohaloarchaea archaeon]